MILVDPRRGSGELVDALAKKAPCSCDDQLPAGDFVFESYCADGRKLVGVERKRIGDMVDCIIDGRFSGFQLIEMAMSFRELYLVIEGMYRPNQHTGVMEMWSYKAKDWVSVRKGNRVFMYAHFDHFLMTLMRKTQVTTWRTCSATETVQWVADLYTHGQTRWDDHTSHLMLHDSPEQGRTASFRKPSLRRMVANKFPSIGWERSKAIEAVFKTTYEMVNASVKDWMQVEGVGKGIAQSLYDKIRSE